MERENSANMKKVQHEKYATWNKCNMEEVQHGKNATWKKSNMEKVKHENSRGVARTPTSI